MTIKVSWVSANRKARIPPDPRYPNGIDIDISEGKRPACFTEIPYPAPECGRYLIKCDLCNHISGVTAAGRADDPKSIRVACKWMPPKGSKLR